MRTRWTLPRNWAEENQDRMWSTWAPFRQPEAFGYERTSINKKLWVNATTCKEKLPFAPPCGMPLSVVSENRIARCAISGPSLDKETARPLRDEKFAETDAASPRGCILEGCIPREVQTQQPESRKTRSAASQPFMFH